jgi:hypothetical protein
MQGQPGEGVTPSPGDICDRLLADHEAFLRDLAKLQVETDARRSLAQLQVLRRWWVIHALAEETVVYKALEGAQEREAAGEYATNADERFAEHELVKSQLNKLACGRPGTLEWSTRVNVVRELIEHHTAVENYSMFSRLDSLFDPQRLRELGERFELACAKLTMLEEAKAA